MMRGERAERGSRPQVTADDRQKYTGVAQHPLGRRWLCRRVIELADGAKQAQAAGDVEAEQRARADLEHARAEARRMGLDVEGRSDA